MPADTQYKAGEALDADTPVIELDYDFYEAGDGKKPEGRDGTRSRHRIAVCNHR